MDESSYVPEYFYPTHRVPDSHGQPVQGYSLPPTQGYAGQTTTGMGVPYQSTTQPSIEATNFTVPPQSTSQPSMGATNFIVPPQSTSQPSMRATNFIAPPQATYQPDPRVYNPYQTNYGPGPVPRRHSQHLHHAQRERRLATYPYYSPINTAVGNQQVNYSYSQPGYIGQPTGNPPQSSWPIRLPSQYGPPSTPSLPRQSRQSRRSRKLKNYRQVQRQTHSPPPQLELPKPPALPSETHTAPLPKTESVFSEAQKVPPESQQALPTTQTAPSYSQTIPPENHTVQLKPQPAPSETQPLPSDAQSEQPKAPEIPREPLDDYLTGLSASEWDDMFRFYVQILLR
ncbi:hypothetical protein F4813DRAFT_398058 [Daldinia decipiens]|uniref:uncharacterized protein n=1 Tax=Daldinia decipiens TaxID=326647 RepID=UPI0020C2D986|nr:uncharacterized protein F4813DRAFT_398058 [Daldinia decipiens]KAI1655654.1 hypothetical protein F4813DRAFT_398058 [Daldinia decipiens]